MPKEIVAVVFRKWGKRNGGGIIAVFPEYSNGYNNRCYNRDTVMMYEHVGQHGEGSYYGVIQRTTPAKPEEYADLKKELEQIGYELKVRQRRPNTRR